MHKGHFIERREFTVNFSLLNLGIFRGESMYVLVKKSRNFQFPQDKNYQTACGPLKRERSNYAQFTPNTISEWTKVDDMDTLKL